LSESRFQSKGANLPAIRCECGAKISIVPDLEEMSQKIDAHALKHKNKEANPSKAEEAFNHIQDNLTIKVLQRVRQSN